jgi:sugar phosphate isomerase/epimerase
MVKWSSLQSIALPEPSVAHIPYQDRLTGAVRSFLLTYSTNVHPGESVDDLVRIVEQDVRAVKRQVFPDQPMGLNLRLGIQQIDALGSEAERARLAEAMQRTGTFLFTVNGFPLQDFHAPRVKEQVYAPSWADPGRAGCTIKIAHVLDALMPEDETLGSISSLTGCFKPDGDSPERHALMAAQIARVVVELARIAEKSGREIVLGLEPEPFTTAETTPESIAYFQDHLLPRSREALTAAGFAQSRAEDLTRRHLGINLDLCHQAVEFEDIPRSVRDLEAAGIRLAGVHVSAALRVDSPVENEEGLHALRAYDEPRYLHQAMGVDRSGGVVLRAVDLNRLGEVTGEVQALKCHFHVPLFQDPDAPLGTTAGEIEAPLKLILEKDLTRHVSLETYTWNILKQSGAAGTEGLATVHDGIAREFAWCRSLLDLD